jgi:hypothetical protein
MRRLVFVPLVLLMACADAIRPPDVTTLEGPGTCVLTARVRDSWGAVGTDQLQFAVSAP